MRRTIAAVASTMLVMALVMASTASALFAADTIRTVSQGTLRGRITAISKSAVTIDTRPLEVVVKVNDIAALRFDDEPDTLFKARGLSGAGQFAEALKLLEGIDQSTISRPEVKQDVEYLIAYCTSQQALGGSASVGTAGPLMLAYLKRHPNSYHFYEANEVIGDLLVAGGKSDQAANFYTTAAQAPWPEAEMRVGIKRGRALLAQNKPADAAEAFERVLNSSARGAQTEGYKLAAILGKASALAAGGKADEGIKMVEGVIAKAQKNDTELHAHAYLSLGNCYRVANKPQEASLAYLHVDLLYFQYPQVHAEALARLAEVWKQLKKPDRARDAAGRLAKTYPNFRLPN